MSNDFLMLIAESMTPELREQAVTLNAAWKKMNELEKNTKDIGELYQISIEQLKAAKSFFIRQERVYKEMISKECP